MVSLYQKEELACRRKVIDHFCSGIIEKLIGTNGCVATINNINLKLVIIFELPRYNAVSYETETLYHNIARIGRGGQTSLALILVENAELEVLSRMETILGINANTTHV